ncbi:SgcJ/EcaC family oxidoreductase [Sphingomonas sp. CL5.1]|uniref:YybH family protein n=1 Tax=Sphingomonas sp. CL5.1 TaxID=2653203 RepID=UPI00158219AB|nr:SgcJ/EcaC family oxidoreductase [Sphingomonas sp. CL5.1]QKS00580.1 SgcJ/EcaC family oxidoreductase [Sphingomonas sp. CL5.1]
MSHDSDRVAAVARAWSAAATPWDADALAALYSTDALLFGGRAGHSVGVAEIGEYFRSYDGVIQSGSLDLFNQRIARIGETALLAQGFCTFAFVLAGGRDTRSVLRATWLLDWGDGRTLIRAHHFSPVPEAPPLGD